MIHPVIHELKPEPVSKALKVVGLLALFLILELFFTVWDKASVDWYGTEELNVRGPASGFSALAVQGAQKHGTNRDISKALVTAQRAAITSKTPWKRVTITWYGPGYHGKRTASGSRYDRNGLTLAVPLKRDRKTPVIPYGTMVEVRYKDRTVTLKATDCCPAGTWDLSDAGMKALGFKSPMQKLQGEVRWGK